MSDTSGSVGGDLPPGHPAAGTTPISAGEVLAGRSSDRGGELSPGEVQGAEHVTDPAAADEDEPPVVPDQPM